MRMILLILAVLLVAGCAGPCPSPLSRDWKGQCSQRGGM